MVPSLWDFLGNWLTPTSLFVIVNIVIGTIAITSHFSSPRHQPQNHRVSYQLARAPSYLDRVKSINLTFSKFGSADTHYVPDVADSPQLARAPSLLARVKSINLSPFYKPDPEPEYQEEPGHVVHEEHETHSPQLARAPSLLERVKSFNRSSFYRPETEHEYQEDPGHVMHENYEVDSPRLARAPSFLQRVRSFRLSTFYNPEPEYEEETGHVVLEEHEVVKKCKSDKEPAPQRLSEKMKKSASEKLKTFGKYKAEDTSQVEKRRPATTRTEKTELLGDEEINAKADDFINKFKQQLKLQRLNSLLRYSEMLNRGTTVKQEG